MKTKISNKQIASAILKGKLFTASNIKQATAIRVAGHRLGQVITVTAGKGGKFVLTKAGSKVTHRPKPKAKAKVKIKAAKKTAPKALKKAA